MIVVSYDNNIGLIIVRIRELIVVDVGFYRVGCFIIDEGISIINLLKIIRIVLFGVVDVRVVFL